MMICLSFRKLLSVAMIRQEKASVHIVRFLTVAQYTNPKTDIFNAASYTNQPRKAERGDEF